MKKFLKTIALSLALVIAVGMVSTAAFAADPQDKPVKFNIYSPDVEVKVDDNILDLVLTDRDKASMSAGAEVRVDMYVFYNDEFLQNIQNEIDIINSVAGTKYKVAHYLDISIRKSLIFADYKLNRSDYVTTLVNPVNVKMEIPEDMKVDGLKYAIIRVHDGEATILKDLGSDVDTITFATDRFSTYALVSYTEDRPAQEAAPAPSTDGRTNPNTGVKLG